MKRNFVLLFTCYALTSLAQDLSENKSQQSLQVSVSYDHDFFVNGYVQVRELEYEGEKLSLNSDFGMNGWNSATAAMSFTFKNFSSLSASYQYYFFSGSNLLNKDFWFNGTHVDGDSGISVNKTRLSKIEVAFEKPVNVLPHLQTSLIAGLVYHRLLFVIDGHTLPDSYRYELFEKFFSQALPYPEIGFQLKKNISPRSAFSAKAAGTYIPYFESFFHEGGDMHLHYYTATAELSYQYSLKALFISPSVNYTALKIYEWSLEDTNDFFINSFGLEVTAGYKF